MKKRPDFISIGYISKAHGIKGEVAITPVTDEPQQFETLHDVLLKNNNGQRRSVTIEKGKVRGNKIIVKFAGIDDRDEALALKDAIIEKRIEDCEPLPHDQYYIFDLIGLKVYTTQKLYLGEIKEVLSLTANDVYVVQDGEKELLIPAIKNVIKKIDLNQEIVLIDPIDGLL